MLPRPHAVSQSDCRFASQPFRHPIGRLLFEQLSVRQLLRHIPVTLFDAVHPKAKTSPQRIQKEPSAVLLNLFSPTFLQPCMRLVPGANMTCAALSCPVKQNSPETAWPHCHAQCNLDAVTILEETDVVINGKAKAKNSSTSFTCVPLAFVMAMAVPM